MNRKIALGLLIATIVAHIALAIGFAVETPYRTSGVLLGQSAHGLPTEVQDIGAPDERQHVNYVARLASGAGFPVFNPRDPNLYETYQSHQPPAFYLLGAAWSKLMGLSDLTAFDAGVKLRSLNALIGGITVAGVFFLLSWGFKDDGVAIVGAAFAALLPMNAALSGAVSNDPMLLCLCTWVLALATLGAVQGWTWKIAIATGILTGLALLTKTTALALLPVLLLAILLKSAKKPSLSMAGAAAVIALVMVAPWWARNQSLYHDPLALQAFKSAFTKSAQKADIVNLIGLTDPGSNPQLSYWLNWVGWWTARSFFGVFGYMDIFLNEHGTPGTGPGSPNTLYRLLLALTFLSAIGWVASLRAESFKERKIAHLLNGTFFAIILLQFLFFNNQYFQAQARYVLPAIGPISGAFAVGICQLLRNRTAAAYALVVLVLGGLSVYALVRLPGEFEKRTMLGGISYRAASLGTYSARQEAYALRYLQCEAG